MSNPYASPTTTGSSKNFDPPGRLLGQVKAIAICSIVQGALEIILGGFYVAMAFLFPVIINNQGQAGAQMPAEEETMMLMIMGIVYGAGGGLSILAGGLRILAGIRNLQLKGRVLGIISFFVGLLNLLTCYCIFTAVGLCVWGCIIYFNPGVAQAFRLRQQGLSVAEIQQQSLQSH